MLLLAVAGPLEQSPRMVTHALNAAKMGLHVSLVGYMGSAPERTRNVDLITVQAIREPRRHGLWRPLDWALRAAMLTMRFAMQFCTEVPTSILIQNPPGLPLILAAVVCRWYSWFRYGVKPDIIVDWHNLGWTIAQVPHGFTFPVRCLRWLEYLAARLAQKHLAVSEALQCHLEELGFEVTVVYDRPYKPSTPTASREEICNRIIGDWSAPDDVGKPRRQRWLTFTSPRVFVMGSSFTVDDRWDLLTDALALLDRPTLVVLTGRGPGLPDARTRFASLGNPNVNVKFGYLSFDDYLALLYSADCGLCLHDSTSGLDLPMKMVDMLACNLPVIAWDYPALTELARLAPDSVFRIRNAKSLAEAMSSEFTKPQVAFPDSTDEFRRSILPLVTFEALA
ncbi:MAG: hypothetical protein KVP17_003372 [Porospora cf. gigantea B]|uniref:uncharacterized protein n=1 Tax=Porospora cf. gigantea B TaxID=2853592 RepID=UPI003571BAF6|nr:MAG: hypothetical protein KVP17_003372 [Porospora cf. gigantea B]